MSEPTKREEELTAWGQGEALSRAGELENLASAEQLQTAQAAAKERRKLVGLSMGQAFIWVRIGQLANSGSTLKQAPRKVRTR